MSFDIPAPDLEAQLCFAYDNDGKRKSLRPAPLVLAALTCLEHFGEPEFKGSDFFTSGDGYDYTGHQLDQQAGLQNARARYYDAKTGRWASQDPIGFDAGDANLYRYVANNPTNATDPIRLWTWRLDAEGRLLGVAEKGDSFRSLISQGYDESAVAIKAAKAGFKSVNAEVDEGFVIDLTSFLPYSAAVALSDQQQIDYEELRPRIELNNPKLPKVPKGKTIGNSGIDLSQRSLSDDNDLLLQREISDNLLGLGQCHGFSAIMLGQQPPPGIDPRQFSLGGLKKEDAAYLDDGHDKPCIETFQSPRGAKGVIEGWYFPEGGLYNYFVHGRKKNLRSTLRCGCDLLQEREDYPQRIRAWALPQRGCVPNSETEYGERYCHYYGFK